MKKLIKTLTYGLLCATTIGCLASCKSNDTSNINQTITETKSNEDLIKEAVESYMSEHKDELKGEKGDTGEKGEIGAKGEEGSRSTCIISDYGLPSDNIYLGDTYTHAITGDIYIDLLTYNLYRYNFFDFYSETNSGWYKIGNIKGNTGTAGTDGRGISNIYFDDDGYLTVVFSDGKSKRLGLLESEAQATYLADKYGLTQLSDGSYSCTVTKSNYNNYNSSSSYSSSKGLLEFNNSWSSSSYKGTIVVSNIFKVKSITIVNLSDSSLQADYINVYDSSDNLVKPTSKDTNKEVYEFSSAEAGITIVSKSSYNSLEKLILNVII